MYKYILRDEFFSDKFLDIVVFNRRKTNIFRDITYIYLHMYIRTLFSLFFFFLPRPAAVRRTVVICRVRACENTTEEYFTFRSVHARPDDSVAVPRHEAFISKYVYRCVQGPGSSLNKCRSIYKGSKMRMFLLSPFYPIPILVLLLLSFFLAFSLSAFPWHGGKIHAAKPTSKNVDKV